MPTIQYEEKVCFVCRQTSPQPKVNLPTSFESPDLDGRPAGAQREAIRYNLEECPHCGYTNQSIRQHNPANPSTLQHAYEIINRTDDPALVRRFIKYAWLLQQTGNIAQAAKQLLQAAWVYDDIGGFSRAVFWRQRALGFVDKCLEDEVLEAHTGDLLCLKADLLRRTNQFGEVLSLRSPHRVLFSRLQVNLLEYQRLLAENEDNKVHSMEEMPNYEGTRSSMTFFL